MSLQQVNLLLRLPQAPTLIISPARVGYITGALLAVLFLVSLGGYGRSWFQGRELAQLNQNKQLQLAKLKDFSKAHPELISNPQLEQEVLRLTNHVKSKHQLINLLALQGQRAGFAPYLQLFAKRAPKKLWLQQIQIDADNNQVMLAGQSLSISLIPMFAERLNQTTDFSQHPITVSKIEGAKHHAKEQAISFVLKTETEGTS